MKDQEHIWVNDLRQVNYKPYEAIIFDCFGTILNITQKRNPYYYYLKKHSILNRNNYSFLMKENLNLDELSEYLGVTENPIILEESKKLLDIEISSTVMFDDAKDILDSLKISSELLICSNLAKPYNKTLEKIHINKVLSFEVGFIKPEIEIYEICLEKLKINPKNILFIGDNFISDYLTPKKIGMNSIWLDRKK